MRYRLGAQIPYDETDAAPHLGALLGRRGGCWKAVQQGVQEEAPEVPEDLPRAAVALALAAAALAAAALAAAAERLQRPYKHGE
eukprot:scaffold95798_cov57-Phaeocystis_antarctica.AAC.1